MASDMDLSPQNNGNTQLLVENRNVQTPEMAMAIPDQLIENVRQSQVQVMEGMDTSDDPEICEFQGSASDNSFPPIRNTLPYVDITSNFELENLPVKSPQPSGEEEDMVISNDPKTFEDIHPKTTQGIVPQQELKTLNCQPSSVDTGEIHSSFTSCRFQGHVQRGTPQSLLYLFGLYSRYPTKLAIGCHGILITEMFERYAVFLSELNHGNIDKLYEFILMGYAGLGCHALAPRDSDEEMANINLESSVEKDMDTSDDPEICEFQGHVWRGTLQSLLHLFGLYSRYPTELAIGCHGILITEMFERYAVFLSDGNMDKLYEFILMGYAGLGCHALAPRDSDEEMANINLESSVEKDMDTSDDPEICEFQGHVWRGTLQSLLHLFGLYSRYPTELAIGCHGILITEMLERYAVFLSELNHGNIDKLYEFILMEYAVFRRKILTGKMDTSD